MKINAELQQVVGSLDFDPDEAEEIAEEIRAAAARARVKAKK